MKEKHIKAIESIRESDPNWWKTRIVYPLANVGLADLDSCTIIPSSEQAEPNQLHEQEEVLSHLIYEMHTAWAQHMTSLSNILAVQVEVEDLVVNRTRTDTKLFFSDARQKIIDEIRELHRWYSGIQDGAKSIAAETRKLVIKAQNFFSENPKNTEEKNEPVKLVEKILHKNLDTKLINKALDESLEKTANEVRSIWQKTKNEIIEDIQGHLSDQYKQNTNSNLTVADFDQSFKIMVSGSLVAVGATLALAAGWHTIGWALAHLFPGALLATIIVGAGYAWLNKDQSRAKFEENAKNIIKFQEEKILSDIELHIRKDARENASRTAESLRQLTFQAYTKTNCSESDFIALIHYLEELLDETTFQYRSADSRQDAKLQRNLSTVIKDAASRLENNDNPAAAFLFGQAVEILFRLLSIRFRIAQAIHQQGYQLQLIDQLHNEKLITKEQTDKLHMLRQRRNWIFHDFDTVTETHTLHLNQWLRQSMQNIEQIAEELTSK